MVGEVERFLYLHRDLIHSGVLDHFPMAGTNSHRGHESNRVESALQ